MHTDKIYCESGDSTDTICFDLMKKNMVDLEWRDRDNTLKIVCRFTTRENLEKFAAIVIQALDYME